MTQSLTLPNGDTVAPDDVLLHDGYPFRYVPADAADRYAFYFSPLYWGDSGMDVPFRDRDALEAQWSDASRGTLSREEWQAWLRDARQDDRFDDAEVDALARELPVDTDEPVENAPGDGILGRVRRILGR